MLEFVLGYTAAQQGAGRAASLARSASVGDATAHSNRIEDLNERIDELAIIIRAMWALLEEQGMTAEQLAAKLEEIDLQDGVADGKATQQPVVCPSCDSRVPAGLSRCQFCGTEVRREGEDPLARL